ncbi:MAG: hypothetical protein O2782_13730 [bacterium]|nr:hypothetical protein [bacterium]
MLRFCRLPALLVALFTIACGPSEDEPTAQAPSTKLIDLTASTMYGSVADVTGYLDAINPYILRIGALQQEYEAALASSRQGAADRRGTGRNLAAQAEAVRPGFQTVFDELDAVQPPPLLAPFHRDTRKMLAARIEALERTIEGWDVEQKGGDFEPVYRDAEAKYEAANQLILQLNTQMNRINNDLQEATASP